MSRAEHHVTAAEDRIPLRQKSAYAVGMFVNNLQAAALPAMVVILNLGLGMDPFLVGLIAAIPRIFDAVSDPMVGYISDNTRSRWGRRRPFILVGAILAGLVFALMWQLPEGRSESFYFWVFLGASILFFLTYTLYATPFVAFGYEMTADYHERTRLHAFANTAGQLVWLGVPWFYAIMANETLFRDTVHGARTLAIAVGVAVAVLGVVPAIACRERRVTDLPGRGGSGVLANTVEFLKGIGITFRCKPFVKICAATFLVFNGFQLGMSFSLYVMIYYLFGGADSPAGQLNGWFGTTTAAATLVVIPLTGWLATHLGKRRTFFFTISLSLVGYSLKWVGYNPEHPYWLLFAAPLVAFGTGSLFTLMGSMIADVCDYDELETGQRREGVFGAIYWWMVKIGMALAGLLTGIMLNASGFDVELEAQPEKTLFLLRVFDVGVPLVTSAIAIAIMLTYEISERRAYEIRAELERRRGKLGSDATTA
ncbi:MAG: MFS transporter [Acidobacteria bacterium]|nr:MFS transporter [Acidobacteriota bacterium]NIM63349.1 MFS transporter [Acidobacteriota bacterium]NIO60088.1 MFS transporter [Acidobacteriota bacterium]NIQ86781.1 MFS transporter [Acidobacteriota bacterium]NIT12120.1 MFS transporter [Acidobacteriota bacterium]